MPFRLAAVRWGKSGWEKTLKASKIILLAIVAALIVAFVFFDLGAFFTLENLKGNLRAIEDFQRENRMLVLGVFFLVYALAMALSLPIATVLTLGAGALFGFWLGVALVSFASTIGATLAFLAARFLFRDAVRGRFASQLAAIDRGVAKDGAFYLFAMRLVVAIPPFVINLAMGVTPIRTWTFYWVSQLGMLAATCVYVNAGLQLAQLESVGDILSPMFVGSFLLLGLFPLVAKKALDGYRARR